ncbi:hypothetical protein [Xylanimonas protaetiae]|uniref:Uncharacterized protein n=1 Tax=Xylanimonas protaetiae TaxID=2509457 RepID=A0A4V0YGF6_9MICO|nr:hypothetical protein [Xylanimonas protaetiae]QAY71041.1 hypothetical protein ET471_14200 [Xylanimonas protaetiae]
MSSRSPLADRRGLRLVGGGDGFSVFLQPDRSLIWSGPVDLDAFAQHLTATSPITPPALDRITVG